MHYQRARKFGTPEDTPTAHAPAEVRFWRGVDRGDPDQCWPYVRGERRGTYGRFQPGGKGSPHVLTHRYSYELHCGPIPEGMLVMHSCDNPRCVNPAHLSLGTHKQNTGDMIAKGRHARQAPRGTANGKAILNPDLVREIRASTETNAVLARRLGVGVTTIRGVRSGRVWSHVT